MKKILLILISTCFVISCYNNSNSNNANFDKDYKKSISIIFQTQIGLNKDFELQEHAMIFLECASGEYVNISNWEILLYKNTISCIIDLKKYKKWYNNNRKNIPVDYIDSIYNLYYKRKSLDLMQIKYYHGLSIPDFKKSLKKQKSPIRGLIKNN